MANDIKGLHHVTAITGSGARNVAFYAAALGLRLVKRTVNFDDPSAWHLYYGDGAGSPGSVMTFFVWQGARRGVQGAGQVAETQFAVPPDALDFWVERLSGKGARFIGRESRFGQPVALFADPEGLVFSLVGTEDGRTPWVTAEIGEAVAIRGFHGVTLRLREAKATAAVLTGAFGYGFEGNESAGPHWIARYRLPGSASGVVDLLVDAEAPRGTDGAGAVHHVAFAVADRAAQLQVRARMQAAGLMVTEQIDRDYFWAIYSRTPGGVLFEVATAEPGFAVDEAPETLGTALKLPRRYEPHRAEIERLLPPLVA